MSVDLDTPHASRIRSLESDIRAIAGVLADLDGAIAVETNPVNRSKHGEQRKLAQATLESLVRELARARRADRGVQLGEALIRLDFKDQLVRFRQLTTQHSHAAFLVHPAPEVADDAEIALDLLVKRLLRALPDHLSTTPIRLGLKTRVTKSTVDALWRKLGHQFDLPGHPTDEQVARRIVERLQNQHVVIVLTDADRFDVDACVEQFLPVLAEAVAEVRPAHNLILLLVDSLGEMDVEGDVPTKLSVKPLSAEDIADWLEALGDDCPIDLLLAAEQSAASIVAATQRNPDGVLEEICVRWGCPDWDLDSWLKG